VEFVRNSFIGKAKCFLSLGLESAVKHYFFSGAKNRSSTKWPFPFTPHETEKYHTELKFCLTTCSCFFGNVLAENLPAVSPDFILGWIAARTFRNHSEKKTTFDLPDQSVSTDLLEARNQKESTYATTEQPLFSG